MKIKMYCIFAKESLVKINGIRGKLATQAGHAYLHAFFDATKTHWDEEIQSFVYSNQQSYEQAYDYQHSERAYKITLVVDTVEELISLQNEYKDVCGTSLVTDAGFTVFKEPTTTCLGIGPIREDLIGESLSKLKTLT